MDLRKPMGGSPQRSSLHSQALNQDRQQIPQSFGRNTYSPEHQYDQQPPGMPPSRQTVDQRYMMRESQQNPVSGHADTLYRVDARHEDLKRQIALKEQLLADMQSERESTRRLRYNSRGKGEESSGTLNRDRSRPGDNMSSRQQFADDRSRPNYPMRSNPRDISPHEQPPRVLSGPRAYEIASAQYRPQSFGDPNQPPQQFSSIDANQPQRLQFYPPHTSNFAKQQQRSSPLRARDVSGSPNSRSRSGARSSYRPSNVPEREFALAPHRVPSAIPPRSAAMPADPYSQPPKIPAPGGSPLRQRTSPARDNYMPPTEVTLTAVPHPILGGEKIVGGPQVREKLYVDRIEAMMLDNASLQRRLNNVSEDFTKMKYDKDELVRKMKRISNDNENLERISMQKDEIDMSNQTMQDDLEKLRFDNKDLQGKMRFQQEDATTAGAQLNVTNIDKQNLVFESHNKEADLMKTLNRIDDLRKQFNEIIMQIEDSNKHIEGFNLEDLGLNHDNIDLASQLARIQAERSDLNNQVQELTIRFDDTVRDRNHDFSIIDDKRRWQTKILVTKRLFQFFGKLNNHQVSTSFRELHDYSNFDKGCHDKLRTFSKLCYKVGMFRQRMALNQWYDNVLKPLRQQQQNSDLSVMIECNQIQARVFYAWRQYLNDKMKRYHRKTNAIEKTWFLLGRSTREEMKRAMAVWKDKNRFNNHKQTKMKQLFNRKNDRLRREAMQLWKNYNNDIEYAVRVRMLQVQASNKIMLSQVFHNFKIQVAIERQDRQRILAHVVKGWRDYVRYNRHLMQANMASIQFVQSNQYYTMKACFASLMKHKETRKYKLLNHAINNDMDPGIKMLEDHNFEKSNVILNTQKYRAIKIVSTMQSRQLVSYMKKWRDETQHYKVTMNSKVKLKIIKFVNGLQGVYFNKWKSNAFNKTNQINNSGNLVNMKDNEILQKEAMQNESELRFGEEFMRTTKRRMTEKMARKLYNRQLQTAMQRWIGICNKKDSQENQFQRSIAQMRKRLLKDAFNKYLFFFKWSRQHDVNVDRSQQYLNKINKLTLTKCFNSFVYFTQRNIRAKRYWNKIFNKLDHFMKQRAIKQWKIGTHNATMENLNNNQESNNEDIIQRSQLLSELQNCTNEQQNMFEKTAILRRNKAYKQIGNYMMRSYSNKTEQSFKLWKAHDRNKAYKKAILLRTIQHYQKNQFLVVKTKFREFVTKDRQNDAQNEIKRQQIDQQSLQTTGAHEIEQAKLLKEEAQEAQSQVMGEGSEFNNRTKKIMLMMERRNQEWLFRSKKRVIFEMWRLIVQQERAFIECTANAITKSLLMKGFFQMVSVGKNNDHDTKSKKLMTKLILKYQKSSNRQCFNKWKKFSLSQVGNKTSEVMTDLQEKDDAFQAQVKAIKQQNAQRVFGYLMDKNKSNIFRAWVTAINFLKLQKSKTKEFHQRQIDLKKEFALKRMASRLLKTKKFRQSEMVLTNKLNKRLQRAVLRAMREHFKCSKSLVMSLGNLERMMRTRMTEEAFSTINTFSKSRLVKNKNDKSVGSADCLRFIKQAYIKQLRQGFNQFIGKQNTNSQGNSKLKSLCSKIFSNTLRDGFNKWRRQHQRIEVMDENYYAGSVRAEFWEANRETENLQDFMRKEAHTEDDIQETMDKVNWRTNGLLRKYIIRWRIKYTEKKHFPEIFDRWKMLVAVRKLVRYQFKYCQNQVHNVKADLQFAFNKWKQGPNRLTNELWKLPLETITELAVRSTQQVGKCSEQLAENQSISNHLMIQRDEFLNYYIKSQVLAMALIKDRCRFSQMQAWSRWSRVKNKEWRLDMLREIRDSAYLQANLELKKKELEDKNAELLPENRDLSGFTTDGQIVKNNLRKIRAECEALKDQIGETDDDYAQLLAENEKLSRDVIKAEARAKQGTNPKFLNLQSTKTPKENNPDAMKQEPPKRETEAQRKQRERFEKLAQKALDNGTSIR